MLKDDNLASLAGEFNVALFASFDCDDLSPRWLVCRSGIESRPDIEARRAVELLLRESYEGRLNVRSFLHGESKGLPFVYGLSSVDEVLAVLERNRGVGLYSIVNETIDVNDGGVSGVRLGSIVEFAPGVTPRGVEQANVAQMKWPLAEKVLSTVYQTPIRVPGGVEARVEFSVHPMLVGHRREHVCVWESERAGRFNIAADPHWPNEFSRHIGDKVFGLLMASSLGARVPYSTVVGRQIAPFSFGERTGTGEWWIRTSPRVPQAGRFTTVRGWIDPFSLLAEEDPGDEIAAILSQEGVPVRYSGATVFDQGSLVIEGVSGQGDDFMVARRGIEDLPCSVERAVARVVEELSSQIGPVRIEWGFDGANVWVLQMHRVGDELGGAMDPGRATSWVTFDSRQGLEKLRSFVHSLAPGTGVVVVGGAGITSHVGDILRKHRVPARFVRNTQR